MAPLSVYIVAGEPSGDRLGGALMTALNGLRAVRYAGVGGADMRTAGLTSRFDMAELTVMGISEVLPRLPTLLRRIRETADDVVAARPDVLITIDSPDFTLRVAKRARRALPDLKIVHYVAPSVWAWRPGRAAKMARHVDHVLALLPFEPPYMEAVGMTCDFVGHPVVAMAQPTPAEVADWRARHGVDAERKLLLLAPGSRNGEVKRLLPDFIDVAARLRAEVPDLALVCPLAETVADKVRGALDPLLPAVIYVEPGRATDKRLAFAAADAALCASGTVTLELAAAGTPMVAAYKTTWLTSQIVRRVIRVNTANLINLISGQVVVPEFLQEFCTPQALTAAMLPLLTGRDAGAAQRAAFDDVMATLGRGGQPPGERAARSVLSMLDGTRETCAPAVLPQGLRPPGPRARHQGRLSGD